MRTFSLVISSPDGTVFDGEAVFMSLRGAGGDLAVMAGHTPFVTSIKPSIVKIEDAEGKQTFGKVEGGLLTVGVEKVTLLSGSFQFNKEE